MKESKQKRLEKGNNKSKYECFVKKFAKLLSLKIKISLLLLNFFICNYS